MIALGFLIFSSLFVVTLVKSLIGLFNHDWDAVGFSGTEVLKIFKWPILSFILFLLFISYGVPLLE